VERRIQNATWLFLGMAAITSCLTFFLDATTRKESAVGLKLDPTYQQIWNVSWGIGGFLIIIGVFWWISRVEVIGHILFGGAIFTEAIAIFVAFGHFVPSMLTLLGFTLASFFRGYWILRILPKRRHGSP
jgi:Zn-dependent membrane protease YugP